MAENRALIHEPITMYTQSESLKDAKDLSKNLMSGDFERQYTEMEKSNKRRGGCVILGVTIGALAVWLVVLTVVREIQLSRLQAQVDGLSASMMEMTLNVVSLNTKVSNNKLFNEFKTLEDTIYADEDQDGSLVEDTKDSSKEKQSYESLEKIKGLTVLEDDSQFGDDEDMYDGDEGTESGDWYPDYDRRRQKIGTTNLMNLTPEDFTSSVIILKQGVLTEIKKRLNDDPEAQDIKFPPATSSSEETGVNRKKRSVFPDAAAEMITDFDPPKVMTKMDERHKTKKVSPMNMEALGKMTLHPVSRTARNSNDEEGNQRRPFIAAHFHGNTSHLSTQIHENYKGNGLVRVAHDAPHDVWYPSPWTIASPHPRPTLTRNGHIHVHHTGVYFVYAQIYYLDSHDIISWVLHRTSQYSEGRDTLLQCAQSSHSTERLDKPNSCFSAAALFLKAGDRLAVRNTGGDRHSLMEPEKSFIGLLKLADAEEPNDEF